MRTSNVVSWLAAAIVLLSYVAWASDLTTPRPNPIERFNKLPLVFETNAGQTDNRTAFVLRDGGLNVSFQKDRVMLFPGRGMKPLTLHLKGIQDGTQVLGENLLSGRSNYLIGNDPAKWHKDIANYSQVRYAELYHGVDLLFYGNGRHLEHDFVVAPGADPTQIELGIEGRAQISLRGDGSVCLKTLFGTLTFEKPVAYQETPQGRREVAARFVARRKSLSFRIGAYDKSLPLIIDPVLVYSTYVTGPHGAVPAAIAVDASGNAYITGFVFAIDFPVAAPASHTPFQSACKSCPNQPDVFVTKLSSDGSSLVYSTYLGGSNYDQPFSIAVDANGNAIVGGRTQSTDFPTQPAVSPTFPSNNTHGFITSLNANGDGLNWSHYAGGTTGDDLVFAVAVDSSNNAYASGLTDSTDFPISPGTLPSPEPAFPINDVFAIKFNSSGTTAFSAILGHNGSGSLPFANSFAVGAMAVDSAGEPIIVGSATPGIPTTPGSFDPTPHATPNTQNRNVFIVKLKSDASSLVFGTYLGGSGGEVGSAVALDSTGNIYLAGSVGSGDFPTTAGAFQTKFSNSLNCCGAFLAKLDPTGSNLIYSTFLGGTASVSNFTQAFSVAVDSTTGNAFVAGDTNDTSFPLLDPVKSSFPISQFGSTHTAFVSQLDSTASHLLFSSIFSGSTGTSQTSMALDSNNKIYLTGTTFDTDLPTTPGVFETSPSPAPNTSVEAPYVAKLDPSVAAASVCLSAITVRFPDTKVGLSNSFPVTVTNCGNADLTFTSISIPAGAFSVQTDLCSGTTVTAGNSCRVTVQFQPASTALFTGSVTFSDNASIGTQKVSLSGNGVLPQVAVTPSVTFDSALIGTTLSNRSILVENTGTIPANIASVTVAPGTDFAIASDGCTGASLPIGNFCLVNLSFTPSAAGPRSGSVTVTDDAVGSPQVISLSGTGVSSYPVPAMSTINPQTVLAASTPPTLSVFGSGFFPASVLRINGVDHATTYQSGNSISATLTAAEIASMGEDSVMVFNPTPGGGVSTALTLTIYTTISVSAQNIVYEPYTRKIYAALSNASPSPNSVVAIDPFALTVGTPKTVGTQPKQMAVSDDGQFLYVGLDGDHTLGRLNLYTNTLDPATSLGTDALTGLTDLKAQDIQVVPGDPHTVAVSVSRPASPAEGGVDLIRDGVLAGRLDNDPNIVSADSIGFAGDPTRFFGTDGFNYYTFGISSGLSIIEHHTITVTGDALGTFVSDGAKFYTNSGRIVDPPTGNILATIPNFTPNFTNFAVSVIPSTDIGRLFFNDLGSTFAVFDSNSLQQTGQLFFQRPLFAGQMVRWGSNGFAINYFDFSDINHANDQIVLFRTSLAFPGPGPSPTPAITGFNPATVNPANVNLTLTINGSNFVTGAVALWNGAERTTTFVSATQLLVKIPAADILVPGTAQVSVVNPGGVGSSAASLTINGPIAALSANSLTFVGQPVGGTSAAQTLTLTNSGNTPLSVNNVSVTGDFNTSNNCGGSLAAGHSCTISVSFAPSATGTRNGTLTETDNATGSPRQVNLSGSGTDFQIGPASGNTSASVQAGQTATYNLSLTGSPGFNGTVSLACSGTPAASNCTLTPASTPVTSAAVPFTVTVTTTAASTAGLVPRSNPPALHWLLLLALPTLLLLVCLLTGSSRTRKLVPAMVGAVMVVAVTSCGGGGTPPPVVNPGTPPGTYTLTVTATNSGASRQLSLTLVVH